MIKLTDLSFGDESVLESNIQYAVIDSYLPYIYLGKSDYDSFVAKLQAAIPDMICDQFFLCHSLNHTCDYYMQDLPSIVVQLDDVLYSIPPETYTQSFGGSKCNVLVKYRDDSSTAIILGNYFLQDFVMSLDYSDVSVKFGVSNLAPANATIEYYTVPPKESFRRRNIVALSLIMAMLLSSVGICVYCRYCHKFASEAQREADAIAYAEPLNRPVTAPDLKER